jgi:hypothetical protein
MFHCYVSLLFTYPLAPSLKNREGELIIFRRLPVSSKKCGTGSAQRERVGVRVEILKFKKCMVANIYQ